MRIIVNEWGGEKIHLRVPSGLALNGLSARLLSGSLKEKGMDISAKQLHILFRAIKAYKATHPEWKLVEVHSHDGDTVEVVV